MQLIFRSCTLALLFLVTACGAHKNMGEADFSMIVFGETGGVVGNAPQYGLSSEGLLLKTAVKEREPSIIRRISDEEMKVILRQLSETREVASFRQEPGNLNRKILIQRPESTLSYYWHLPDEQVPTEVLQLYNTLMTLLNGDQ